MEDFRELGKKYLGKNKKRSFLSALGCFIVAAVLFMFLNTMCCWIDKSRMDARQANDYDIVILTEDRNKIEKIANEDFVKSSYLGKEYSWLQEDEDDTVYSNVLHINVKTKILMKYYANYITKNFDVETKLNEDLAWTYFQDDGGAGYLIILFGLFIAFIMAIIGVGLLRNNISMSALERVKDYGDLRCIGATKKQIKAIVLRETLFIETIGIVAGIFAGFLLSIPICLSDKRQYPIGFHIIPVILVVLVFYFDMYFSVNDGLKKVLSDSPSEAVRGNYRIKARGIKRRSSGIWGLIFGIEGDYAYKNIKRNNGRFIKTVMSMVFGMIILIVLSGWMGAFFKFLNNQNKIYGQYQHYIEYDGPGSIDSYDEQKVDLYSTESLETICSAKGIENPKYVYKDDLYTAENGWVYNHINEEYNTNTFECIEGYGSYESLYTDEGKQKQSENYNARKAYRDSGKGLVDYENREPYDEEKKRYTCDRDEFYILNDSSLPIYGYDAEDYARYEDALVEGTTELSENGVLLVNQAHLTSMDDFKVNALFEDMKPMPFTDIKLGDEITIVDPKELYNLVQEEIKNAKAYEDSIKDTVAAREDGMSDEEMLEMSELYDIKYSDIFRTNRKEAWIINSAREKLIEEGKCKKFIVEGIIEDDPNRRITEPSIVVPLDRFCDITGRTKSDYNGMQFHVSNIFSKDLSKAEFQSAIKEKNSFVYDPEEAVPCNSITSHYFIGLLEQIQKTKDILGIVAAVIVIIIITLMNTINATLSSLQTRRNEFAQLRSIGMTKKSLLKSVILEGGIVWIISTILGLILGIGIEYAIYLYVMKQLISSPMMIFWSVIIATSILSLIVLCGSNYMFFNQMKLNVGEELTRSGE